METSLSKSEIQKLFKTARRIARESSCDILIAPRLKPLARLLVVTSRKVGSAPMRNKVRRRLKAIFHEQKLFNQPHDCIVIIKQAGTLLSFDQWKNLLLTTLDCSPVLPDPSNVPSNS